MLRNVEEIVTKTEIRNYGNDEESIDRWEQNQNPVLCKIYQNCKPSAQTLLRKMGAQENHVESMPGSSNNNTRKPWASSSLWLCKYEGNGEWIAKTKWQHTRLTRMLEPQELSFAVGGNAKWHRCFGGQFVSFRLSLLWPYDPAVTRLRCYPEELKAYVHTEACLHRDVHGCFIHNCQKAWKQPWRPSLEEWINKLVHPDNAALRRNELSSHRKMGRKLGCRVLCGRSQCEKSTGSRIPSLWRSGKGKTVETVMRPVVARVAMEKHD